MQTDLYAEHVAQKLLETRGAMADLNIEKLIFFSGETRYGFRDDLPYPFRANPYFLEWVHIPEPDCFLYVHVDGDRPQLFIREYDDYWHSPAAPLREDLANCFDITRFRDARDIDAALTAANAALIGEAEPEGYCWPSTLRVNPAELLLRLDSNRATKTPWELDCVRRANCVAVSGHRAAERRFHEGASELQIHLSYMDAVASMEADLPYGNIVAINENAAVLHHWRLSNRRPSPSLSLLIDAGAAHCGYAADITRTHAAQTGLFADLVNEMDRLQQSVAKRAAPGVPFPHLHAEAFTEIGNLLRTVGIISLDPGHPMFHQVVSAFFPHGLGHFLGVQVHDKGGHCEGTQASALYPNLRLTRTLAPGNVVTVEPGLYFIPQLLDKLRASPARRCIDWQLVEELLPYGGIRIEDNLIITETGAENVTRQAFGARAGALPARGVAYAL